MPLHDAIDARYDDARQHAAAMRRASFHIDEGDPISVTWLLEFPEHVLTDLNVRPVSREEARSARAEGRPTRGFFLGASLEMEREIQLLEERYVAARNGEPHATFLTLHELAHQARGHPGARFDFDDPARGLYRAEDRPFEAEANAFAAELIAPVRVVAAHRDLEDLRALFNAPREVLLLQRAVARARGLT